MNKDHNNKHIRENMRHINALQDVEHNSIKI